MTPGPGEVRIRWATPEDAERVRALISEGSRDEGADGPGDPTPYAEVIAQGPPGGVLVAEADGEVVGVCQLLIFRHLQHRGGWCAELESVHVDGRFRSLGIGGRLLEEAVDAARAAGCYRVQLTSHHARADAHRFYERHGFAATHRGYKRMLR